MIYGNNDQNTKQLYAYQTGKLWDIFDTQKNDDEDMDDLSPLSLSARTKMSSTEYLMKIEHARALDAITDEYNMLLVTPFDANKFSTKCDVMKVNEFFVMLTSLTYNKRILGKIRNDIPEYTNAERKIQKQTQDVVEAYKLLPEKADKFFRFYFCEPYIFHNDPKMQNNFYRLIKNCTIGTKHSRLAEEDIFNNAFMASYRFIHNDIKAQDILHDKNIVINTIDEFKNLDKALSMLTTKTKNDLLRFTSIVCPILNRELMSSLKSVREMSQRQDVSTPSENE